VDAWFTNTAPVDAYRGAGRPEATYLLERLVSRCGWELGLSQDEIRKRNFITSFPYQTPVALQYDVGDYRACMDKAEKLADVAGFAARKASEAKGLKRGIGYSVIHRGLRHRAVEHRRRAGRPGGPVRVRRDSRAPDRQRHGVYWLAQPRPGP
jgi:CO/xanthine dehydrogenase Mo-binding subunit